MTPGKIRGMNRLSDIHGRFFMLALDQRESLKKALINKTGNSNKEMIKTVKKAILKTLSSHVTAVLVDPEYSYPHLVKYIYPQTGIILAVEKSGYEENPKFPQERLNRLIDDEIVTLAKKWGCDAIKLLIYWSDNLSDETVSHQESLVKKVGDQAKEEDILFILEILTYGPNKGHSDLVLNALEKFSDDVYSVDLFKIEPLKDVSREDVEKATKGKPWVILSGGVDIETFEQQLTKNISLGCSGILAGRVIWKGILDYPDDYESMEFYLQKTGVQYIERLKPLVNRCSSWYNCAYYGGFENIKLVIPKNL
jgi:tagatose 1,6-diphosphate aldolase